MKSKLIPLLLASLLLGSCAPAASPNAQNFESPTAVADMSSGPQSATSAQSSARFDCQNIQEIAVEDCQALVALYESTDGDHWQDNSGWMSNDQPCTWKGVICQQNHVLELQLYNNNLGGSLPPEIGKLTQLQSLSLDRNQLTGPVPAELGNLTNLKQLHLANNELSGPIPRTLRDLTSLNELELSFNQLTGSIPSELGDLRGLYRLDLSYNDLTGAVPARLAKAPISDLRLWGNQLDGTVWTSEGTTAVDYQGVHFEVNAALAESVWPEVAAALPPVDGEFAWETRPEHIQFTFASYAEPDSFQGGGMNISGHPQIFIYPTQTFSRMSDRAKGEIEVLQALLKAHPAAPDNEIPVLPLINAAQVFHTQVKYVDFQNGSGVRFITHYSQEDVSRVTKKNIFYTFQGLTQNGEYYVAVYFPISEAGLPDEPLDEDWEAAQARLTETISHLDSLSPDEFEPGLDALDRVVQSLIVNPP